MSSLRKAILLAALCGAGGGAGLRAQQAADSGFDHQRHAKLFPTCTACHAGAEDPDKSLWPDPGACAQCHDGTTRPKVAWTPPAAERPSNLKFGHDMVSLMPRQTPSGSRDLTCQDCHSAPGEPWMSVRRATPQVCLACHAPPGTQHLAADTLCQTCHIPLTRAASLRPADVAAFPAPDSHRQPDFVSREGHGRLARTGSDSVAQSCTVCHSRDFCVTCHVDAPEQAPIQALAADTRGLAIVVRLQRPASHTQGDFLSRHGSLVRADAKQCATCHTRESCLVCHAPSQQVASALYARGPGRGPGAQTVRRPPDSHGQNFAARHGPAASAKTSYCAGCHVQTDCFQCHRQNAGTATAYHPSDFLSRHPAAAYARDNNCSDCHNTAQFCTSCHKSAGLVATSPLRGGYHDANHYFLMNHGQAARQSLETCTSCHVEQDCLKCHSAMQGRHFNPHGPGFDAETLRRKNPQMCAACHGTNIPTQ